jgi:1-deoxy-D-xylulose-5-phosphate synthase
LCEATRIDGSSEYGIWLRIILPLSKPAISTLVIFTFVNTWNDFLGPQIYLIRTELKTIQIGLRMFISQYSSEYGLIMAAGTVTMIPVFAVYSTFLQRSYDMLLHDVAISGLHVVFCVDRAGIVGPDGETHHGLFDIAMIKNIPNFIFLAPSSGEELRDMIYFAAQYDDGPIAIRFPKGVASNNDIDLSHDGKFTPGKIKRLSHGKDLTIIALGDMTSTAVETAALLERKGIKSSVINLQSIRPLDIKAIEKVLDETSFFITLENGIACGGIGEHITACIRGDLRVKNIFIGAFPDKFIPHGNDKRLLKEYALDPESLARRVLGSVKNERKTHTA